MTNDLNIYKIFNNDVTSYFEEVIDTVIDYKEMLLTYDCAIKEIKTKVDILDAEFGMKYRRNPISSIRTRLKSNASLMNKISRLSIETDVETIRDKIEDIAGVRIICNYIDDIYMIADALIAQDDIELLKKKDYISNPKSNGYRSLHLIINVPVFFANNVEKVKVEIQIRTIAMDFWASLEHQMRYKKTELDSSNSIIDKLTGCANVIAKIDEEMLSIRQEIDSLKTINNSNEILLEKLRKLSM